MSTTAKWIVGAVVVAVIAAALWWGGVFGGKASAPAATQAGAAAESATTNTPPPTLNGMSQANDTSDAATNQDVGAVDAQVQGLNSDSAGVSASASDKPVGQAY